jgi:hypothetical protein
MMRRRTLTRWHAGLIAMAASCALAAVAAAWIWTMFGQQAVVFQEEHQPSDGSFYTDEQYAHMNRLWMQGDAALDLVVPFVVAALTALFLVLALLAAPRVRKS